MLAAGGLKGGLPRRTRRSLCPRARLCRKYPLMAASMGRGQPATAGVASRVQQRSSLQEFDGTYSLLLHSFFDCGCIVAITTLLVGTLVGLVGCGLLYTVLLVPFHALHPVGGRSGAVDANNTKEDAAAAAAAAADGKESTFVPPPSFSTQNVAGSCGCAPRSRWIMKKSPILFLRLLRSGADSRHPNFSCECLD